MARRILALLALAACSIAAQTAFPSAAAEEPEPEILPFLCPMDPEIRAKSPGVCSKCGMALVLGLPEFVDYPVRLSTTPAGVAAGEPVELAFEILDPEPGERQRAFHVVHEKIFHLLYVSHDLEIFGHEHPVLGADGVFRLRTVFPKEGAYRLLADFYPHGATPQMAPLTLITKGFSQGLSQSAPKLQADREPKRGENLEIRLRTEPAEPLATFKTMLFFELDTAEGLEKFLGAWAHMLAAGADLENLIHAHPAIADGGPAIQMNVIFPLPGMYRIWVQIQRSGVVNTVPFTIEVAALSG